MVAHDFNRKSKAKFDDSFAQAIVGNSVLSMY